MTDLALVVDTVLAEAEIRDIELAKLSAKRRKKLKTRAFALPEKRAYPIHDRSHAVMALRMRGHASPEDQNRIVAAVKRRYPDVSASNADSAIDLAMPADGTAKWQANIERVKAEAAKRRKTKVARVKKVLTKR